jgi:hypothetical protein
MVRAVETRNAGFRGRFLSRKRPIFIVNLPDAVAMILALVIVTSTPFWPSPTATSPEMPDLESQPAATRNLSVAFAGVDERLQGGHLLNCTAGSVPGAAAGPPVPEENQTAPEAENSTVVVPDYDDEELARLVEENGVSLMLLSVQNAYALYAWDEVPARESAAALSTLARDLLRESAPFEVSDDGTDLKSSFTHALESYTAVGETLQGTAPLNRTMVDAAIEANRQGSDHLRDAFEHLEGSLLEVPEEIVAADLSLSRPSVPENALPLLQRYVYGDRTGANDISLMLESVRSTGVYYILSGGREAVVAEPGRTFLLVQVKATNLGHKGESRTYTIRTPEVRAFTLQYRGTTYAPMKLAPGTSLGEPYTATKLDRYEVTTGYLVFDVPEALNLDESTVRVTLDGGASPVWAPGKSL